MIDELDRSNEMVNKHMAEYEQAEQDLSLEEKIDLIKVLLNYQKNLAQVKKYQAQQQRLGSKKEENSKQLSKRMKTVKASKIEPSQEQQTKDPNELSDEE
ncbi:hypothetical protein Tco_1309279, partial [Tanacetum coccineum]